MVSFRTFTLAAIAAISAVTAQSTPAQVVQNINLITQKSQALQPTAESITLINGALLPIGQGPLVDIIRGYQDIISTANTGLSQMQGMPPVAAGAQSDAIFGAFRSFVSAQQQLLSMLISKADLFQSAPVVGGPMVAILNQFDQLAATLTSTLIGIDQTQAADIDASGDSLSLTVGNAIDAYSGLRTSKRSAEVMPISRVKRAITAF